MKAEKISDAKIHDELLAVVENQALPLIMDYSLGIEHRYGDDDVKDSVAMLITLISVLFRNINDHFHENRNLDILRISVDSRNLLETYATICWILENKDTQVERAKKFIQTGYDLLKHINSLADINIPRSKRTRSRLPSTELRLKLANGGAYVGWYDQLNYFAHPSSALIMQFYNGGFSKLMNINMTFSCTVCADSILKSLEVFDTSAGYGKRAEALTSTLIAMGNRYSVARSES